VASLRSDVFLVEFVIRMFEVFIDEENPSTGSKDTHQLDRCSVEVMPVVHRVDSPCGVDRRVIEGKSFSGGIDHGERAARSREPAPKVHDRAHVWRGVESVNRGPSLSGGYRRGPHARSDVDTNLARLWVDGLYDIGVGDARPHPGRLPHVTEKTAQTAVSGMPVGVTAVRVAAVLMIAVLIVVVVSQREGGRRARPWLPRSLRG